MHTKAFVIAIVITHLYFITVFFYYHHQLTFLLDRCITHLVTPLGQMSVQNDPDLTLSQD